MHACHGEARQQGRKQGRANRNLPWTRLVVSRVAMSHGRPRKDVCGYMELHSIATLIAQVERGASVGIGVWGECGEGGCGALQDLSWKCSGKRYPVAWAMAQRSGHGRRNRGTGCLGMPSKRKTPDWPYRNAMCHCYQIGAEQRYDTVLHPCLESDRESRVLLFQHLPTESWYWIFKERDEVNIV